MPQVKPKGQGWHVLEIAQIIETQFQNIHIKPFTFTRTLPSKEIAGDVLDLEDLAIWLYNLHA